MFKPRDSRDNSSNKRFGDSSTGRGGGHRSGGEFGTASKFGGGGGPPRGAFPGPKRDDLNLMSLQRPNFSKMDLKPFGKEFYQESSSVSTRTQHDVNGFYRENNAVVNNVGSARILRPILQFNELSQSISRNIVEKLFACNYDKPTPIQSFCWPTLLAGQNMVGIAQTGSGKTLGFVLPMLVHISNNERYLRSFGREQTPGPMALILAPTRELAQQIQQVADSFGQVVGLRNIVIYGGASKGPQLGQIRRGAEIYIATPGRLLDFLKENTISLQKCTYLVLDEADRMLDMGFEPQIRKIIEQIRPDRQTAMFSATWPKEVRKLAEDFISNYTHISIGTQVLTANPNIRQIVEVMEEPEKETRLRDILGEIMNQRDSKAIIFAETKKRVDSISMFIKKLGYYCLTIHGDKKQMEREWVLNEFKQRPKAILCATDVAARGLSIQEPEYCLGLT